VTDSNNRNNSDFNRNPVTKEQRTMSTDLDSILAKLNADLDATKRRMTKAITERDAAASRFAEAQETVFADGATKKTREAYESARKDFELATEMQNIALREQQRAEVAIESELRRRKQARFDELVPRVLPPNEKIEALAQRALEQFRALHAIYLEAEAINADARLAADELTKLRNELGVEQPHGVGVTRYPDGFVQLVPNFDLSAFVSAARRLIVEERNSKSSAFRASAWLGE
jgi:hypothetical protein